MPREDPRRSSRNAVLGWFVGVDARSTVDWLRVLCEVTTVWYAYIQLCNPILDVNRFLNDTLGSRMMYSTHTPSRFDHGYWRTHGQTIWTSPPSAGVRWGDGRSRGRSWRGLWGLFEVCDLLCDAFDECMRPDGPPGAEIRTWLPAAPALSLPLAGRSRAR